MLNNYLESDIMSNSQLVETSPTTFLERFKEVRQQTLHLVDPLETEDFVVQPTEEVSPPKWHLAHTTWFFEVFLLVPNVKSYQLYHKGYPYLFNSYYISAGDRWTRALRGDLTRPTVKEVLTYRAYVEYHMEDWLSQTELSSEQQYVLEVGLQHEQQHQELLLYDLKYILGHNPLFPIYRPAADLVQVEKEAEWLKVEKGNYKIGYHESGFCFDNELGYHEIHLEAFEVCDSLVTNREYLEFMNAGGYEDHRNWLSEGWDWSGHQSVKAPMYWMKEDETWRHYTLAGVEEIVLDEPVAHLSFYEADAYARWKGCRLPTEFEWEVAAGLFEAAPFEKSNFVNDEHYRPVSVKSFFGNLWQWTSSAYLPYPFYKAPDGALGEYNGKFMINQKVLRGGSYATPRNHIRLTYRNFFHPHLQWLFSGVRLARHV